MKFIAPLLVVMALSGCALTVDKIDIPYQGKANITVVEGAENVSVEVTHDDKRTVYKDRVGTKKNGYGMEMAEIVATNDLAQTIADAISFELENEGFKIGTGGKVVHVELVRLYNDFKIGFWSGSAVADGVINVQVHDPAKHLIYTHSYEGGGVVEGVMVASGDNAREALIKAMADIVSKVAQDIHLHSALLEPVETMKHTKVGLNDPEKK